MIPNWDHFVGVGCIRTHHVISAWKWLQAHIWRDAESRVCVYSVLSYTLEFQVKLHDRKHSEGCISSRWKNRKHTPKICRFGHRMRVSTMMTMEKTLIVKRELWGIQSPSSCFLSVHANIYHAEGYITSNESRWKPQGTRVTGHTDTTCPMPVSNMRFAE